MIDWYAVADFWLQKLSQARQDTLREVRGVLLRYSAHIKKEVLSDILENLKG